MKQHISGRLTLHMLHKMKKERESNEANFNIVDETLKVKNLLKKKEKLKDKKD